MTHPILERLQDPAPDVRRAACVDAAKDPSATLLVDALAETLGDPAKAVVRAASDALVAISERSSGSENPVLPALRTALHGTEPMRRWGAAFTIARLEPPTPRLLPALVEALGSTDGDVRWAATRLIVDTGRLHGEVLPLLVGLVRTGEHAIVRRMATFALRELAPDRAEAALVLLEATRDTDQHVRRAAFTAMASLVEPSPEVGDRLLETLRSDPDTASRRLAALALGELGAADPRVVPADTREALEAAGGQSEDPDLRRAVSRALDRLGERQPE